jgi:hypothetical protein
MGVWDRIMTALRGEKRDLDDLVGDVTARGNAAMDKAERELHATPEEKLEIERERGEAIDDEFDAVRRRIEGSGEGDKGGGGDP